MKKTFIIYQLFFLFTATTIFAQTTTTVTETSKISHLLDSWHEAAATAKFDAFFAAMSADAIYIGTDATEHWDVPAFKKFAKPFFDRGKTWFFKSLKRNIYFDASGNTAWFDELLDTQMKICRGSGVLVKENGTWKIKQYVLSMTIPNEDVNAVVTIKTPIENTLIEELNSKK